MIKKVINETQNIEPFTSNKKDNDSDDHKNCDQNRGDYST